MSIKPEQSITGTLCQKINPYLTPDEDGCDGRIEHKIKIGASFIAHPILAVALAVEMLVRSIFLLLAKIIHVVLSFDPAKQELFKGKCLTPIHDSVVDNGEYILRALTKPILNLTRDIVQDTFNTFAIDFFNCFRHKPSSIV